MIKEFIPFPKLHRLNREVIITEKIDGTNASITITEEEDFLIGSRTRFITPKDDNFGFAAWCYEHKEQLLKLGVGTHFGEWWGKGIQRGYNLDCRRFSLFNTARWHGSVDLPLCCSVVPVLWRGLFDTTMCHLAIEGLKVNGSKAAPGFMKPEGIVVFHTKGNVGFKYTCEKDEQHKFEQ